MYQCIKYILKFVQSSLYTINNTPYTYKVKKNVLHYNWNVCFHVISIDLVLTVIISYLWMYLGTYLIMQWLI